MKEEGFLYLDYQDLVEEEEEGVDSELDDYGMHCVMIQDDTRTAAVILEE